MTSKQKGSSGKSRAKKLAVKKETLKDLEARNAKGVKGGGALINTFSGCQVKAGVKDPTLGCQR